MSASSPRFTGLLNFVRQRATHIVLTVAVVVLTVIGLTAQLGTTPPAFAPGQTIKSSTLNTLFSQIDSRALNRTGGIVVGHILFSPDGTVDIGASAATRPRDIYVADDVVIGDDVTIGGDLSVSGSTSFAALSATSGTFSSTLGVTGAATLSSTLTVGSTGAAALDVAGGIQAGSGNVSIIGTDGRIPAISSTYFASLSGANLTGVPETAITDGSLLARVADNETISGAYTFTGVPTISGTQPFLRITETDASANEQRWWLVSVAGTSTFQAVNDAEGAAGVAWSITRSGATPQLMTVKTAWAVDATLSPPTLAAGNNNDYSPTGHATAYIFRLTGNATPSKITGIAGGVTGREIKLCNISTDIYLTCRISSGRSLLENSADRHDKVLQVFFVGCATRHRREGPSANRFTNQRRFEFRGRQIGEARVRPYLVVMPTPLLDGDLGLDAVSKPMER